MNKLVFLFDFDGTIADTFPSAKPLLEFLGKKYKFETFGDQGVELLRNKSAKEVMAFLKIPAWKIPFIAHDMRRLFQEHLPQIQVVKGMRESLESLKKKGFVVGILTSNSQENVKNFLSRNNITSIDLIVGNIGVFNKSKAIDQVIKKLSIPKDNVFYIGDEVRDIEAAKKSGVKTISVTWGFNSPQRLMLSQPDYIINQPKQLISIHNKLP